MDAAAYGRRANAIFAAFRGVPGADDRRLELVVGAQAASPGRNIALLTAAPLADTVAIAPYLMHSVDRWGSDDELFGPLLAQPEQMSREGIVSAAQAQPVDAAWRYTRSTCTARKARPRRRVLNRFAPSAAAGVAVAGHMLRMMREHGVREQMLYSLPQFQFKRSDGAFVRLWGAVVEMGAESRKRPQFLAVSLANRVIRGDLMHVEVTGENPTHDQLEGNDGVHLKGVHELDTYAFKEGNRHGLIVFNYGQHQARRVRVEAPGAGALCQCAAMEDCGARAREQPMKRRST